MCSSCGVKIVAESNLGPGVYGVPLKAVMKDNFAALLMWGWCINENKVKDQFKAQAGLDISDSNLENIIKAHELGNDLKGYNVNFADVLRSVRFSQVERDNATCKVKLTIPQ